MKGFWWIVKTRLESLKRHPLRGAMIFLLPLVSVLLYSIVYANDANDSSLTIGYVTKDTSAQSRQLQKELSRSMTVKTMSASQAKKEISQFTLDGYVLVPADYGQQVARLGKSQVTYTSNLEKGSLAQLKKAIQQATQNINRLQRLAGAAGNFGQVVKKSEQQAISLQFRAMAQKIDQKILTVSVIGFITMLMLFQSGNFGSQTIIEERREGVFYRLLTTPLTKTAYFGGTAFVSIFILALEALCTLGLIHWIMKVNFGWGFWGIFGLLILFGGLATSWSLAIGMLTAHSGIASAVQTICFVTTAMLSGSMIPIEAMPNSMQQMAQLMPQFWLLKGIQLIQNQQTGKQLLYCVVVLLAFTFFFFCLAFFGYQSQKRVKLYQ